MFEWNEDKVRFRIDSARHSRFHEQTATLIASRFDDPASVSICDAGCGLGFLSAALTECFGHVTAIDVSPLALDVLRREADSRHITNLELRQEDLLGDPSVRPELYDAIVFSFFGNISEIMRIARPRCRKDLFILKKNDHHHRFSVSHPMRPFDSMAAALHDLHELSLPFTKTDLCIEDGQPLRSLEDALIFFGLYAQGADRELITQDYVKTLLQETDDPEFPYYYPRATEFSLLQVDLSELPRSQGGMS